MADADTFADLFTNLNAGSELRPASSGYGDLNQFQNSIKQNDVYGDVARLIGGARFNTSTWSPGQTAGVTAGQAFLSTILKGLGQRSEARQMDAVTKLLPELYSNPDGVEAPDGVDSDAFAALKLSGARNKILVNAAKAKQEEEFNQQLKRSVMADVFNKNPAAAAKYLGLDIPAPTGIDAVPDALKSKALDEQGIESEKAGVAQDAREAFQRAKSLTGIAAAARALTTGMGSSGLPTEKGKELDGLRTKLSLYIDKAAGREINDQIRREANVLAPQWHDSDAELDRKSKDYQALLDRLSKKTPTLEHYGLQKKPETDTGTLPPPPAGMKYQRNKRTGETRLVTQ